ncbi:MAG: hypothetical protein A3G18_07280 [Rhodospirillales bacterium RIFCSPLOWO2_12_FULL_58_28]|nr:MAG: hypothetical protein A3H92_09250 [Rhodospirillales bacterium RIFCSPLOWO2_02_FULL_58_16]OHC79320.1 MAG: hypothetical protein A3G18_07280 [Rhodospirillales bacterium RIFCSPLOWO2_12_FULL_58_28]
MQGPPWDQRIARILVKPLVNTPVTPNHLTILSLLTALAGAGLFAVGDSQMANWGAGLFVLARFMDHFDGELARQQASSSRLGYFLDYIAGALSYGTLFFCIGAGLYNGPLGSWAVVLGVAGTTSAILSMFLNLNIDKALGGETVGYPGFAGFELEDGIYLLAPITWLGYLEPFFIACGIGASVYCLWTLWTLLRLKNKAE